MVFKSALHGEGEHIIGAVWIILAAGTLLLSLAVYIYLGSKAETLLIEYRNQNKKNILINAISRVCLGVFFKPSYVHSSP